MDHSTHSVILSNNGFHEDVMVGTVSVTHNLFVLFRELHEISFQLIKLLLSIHYVPGSVLNAVTVKQCGWEPPLPKLWRRVL